MVVCSANQGGLSATRDSRHANAVPKGARNAHIGIWYPTMTPFGTTTPGPVGKRPHHLPLSFRPGFRAELVIGRGGLEHLLLYYQGRRHQRIMLYRRGFLRGIYPLLAMATVRPAWR